jgi:hypothetical protein
MRIIYNKISKKIIGVFEDGQSVTVAPEWAGIIQGNTTDILEIANILGLNISKLDIIMEPHVKKLHQDKAKGRELVDRFLAENKQVDLSTEDSISQLSQFLNLKLILEAGAIMTGRDMLLSVPEDVFAITPGYETKAERKQSYIDEMNDYLENNY